MAVEKNAVRKDTRWMFCANVVVVDEVTSEHVIYRKHDTFGLPEVTTLRKFLDCARDPATAEHERLMDGLLNASHDLPSDSETGKLLKLLRDAAIWHLERACPSLPVYVAPVIPPKAAPIEAEIVAKAMPAVEVEECSTAMPLAYERLVEDEPPARKRRFA
ncbi:hypothetical protein [Methylobacterium sp.]|uniref:hypothetical protein n=1 Tax=Methylobacterium sp. TaxID=409 RepID=UPI0025E62BE0|nr:hypothetical protein [Methylobacterium sp.]MBY0258551.1 hypothetical protein [Methylobacterium sp.]